MINWHSPSDGHSSSSRIGTREMSVQETKDEGSQVRGAAPLVLAVANVDPHCVSAALAPELYVAARASKSPACVELLSAPRYTFRISFEHGEHVGVALSGKAMLIGSW